MTFYFLFFGDKTQRTSNNQNNINQTTNKESDFYYETLSTILEAEMTPNGQNSTYITTKWCVGLVMSFLFSKRYHASKSELGCQIYKFSLRSFVFLRSISASIHFAICSTSKALKCAQSSANSRVLGNILATIFHVHQLCICTFSTHSHS